MGIRTPRSAATVGGVLVAGVDVADHAHARVVGQHPRELLRGQFGAVGDGDLAGVDGAAHPDPAAVVNRHPRRARRRVDQRVEQRPVGDRVGAVEHRLGLAVRRGHRPGVEVVAADHDRGRQLAGRHHLVELQPGQMPLAVAEPADACGQPLERDLLAGHGDPPRAGARCRGTARGSRGRWRRCPSDHPTAPPTGTARGPPRTAAGCRRGRSRGSRRPGRSRPFGPRRGWSCRSRTPRRRGP